VSAPGSRCGGSWRSTQQKGSDLLDRFLEAYAVAWTVGEFVDAMSQIEDGYRTDSRLLTLEEWLRRPRREKVFDNLMRLTSSLM